MTTLVHFEITAEEVGPLAGFYREVLGWGTEPSPFLPDYTLLTGGNVSGAVMARRYRSQPVIPWFEVPDLDAALARILSAGGAAAGERQTLPGQGNLIYVTDPQGNLLGLRQPLS